MKDFFQRTVERINYYIEELNIEQQSELKNVLDTLVKKYNNEVDVHEMVGMALQRTISEKDVAEVKRYERE